MGHTLTKIAIGAAIIGLAFATGGATLVPSLAATGTGIGATAAVAGYLSTTALGSTLLIAGAGEVLSGVAGGLTKKPSASASQISRTSPNIDPATPRKTVYGRTAFPYDIRYYEYNGPAKDICDQVVCFASHKIESIDEIWIGPELAWTSTGAAQGRFAGYFFADIFPEGGANVGDTLEQGIWTSGDHRLTGCAWGHFRFHLSGLDKKTDGPFSSGLPTKVTIIGKGAMLYDPRRDSTVPGGSGPMRADDQTTWRFTTDDGDEIGDNPALHALHRLLGWRINGRLAVGAGVPPKRLALPSFGAAASLAEEQVSVAAGGTEQRYRGAGLVSEADEASASLNTILAGCCGRTRDDGGQISLWIAHNDLATAATDDGLFDDDVISAHTWISDGPLDQTPNVVAGKYTDARTTSLYQLLPYPDIRIASLDGIDRPLPLDLSMVESVSQAQRVAKQTLERKQYSGRTFAATFDIRAWKYRIGSIVPLTYAPLSFNRQFFRVREMTPALTGCEMVLEAESPDIYQWDASDAPAVAAAAPTVYNHKDNVLIAAIDDAETLAQQAKDDAAAINLQVTRIASDGWLSAGEKPEIIRTKTAMDQEVAPLNAQANALGITTQLEALNNAKLALDVYISSLSPAWNDTTQDTAINPTTFRGKFTDYEYAKVALVNAMANSASKTSTWTGVVDNDPNHPKPKDGADVTSLVFQALAQGRSPQQVLDDADQQALNILANATQLAQYKIATDQLVFNAQGQPIGVTLQALQAVVDGHDTVYAQLVRTDDGLFRVINTINSDGAITGTENFINGERKSEYYVIADIFGVVQNVGGVPVKPFVIIDGVAYFDHVRVRQLDDNVAMVPGEASQSALIAGSYSATSGDIPLADTVPTSLSVDVTMPYRGRIKFDTVVQQHFDGLNPGSWAMAIDVDGVILPASYVRGFGVQEGVPVKGFYDPPDGITYPHTFTGRLRFQAESGVSISNRNMSAEGFPRTT